MNIDGDYEIVEMEQWEKEDIDPAAIKQAQNEEQTVTETTFEK